MIPLARVVAVFQVIDERELDLVAGLQDEARTADKVPVELESKLEETLGKLLEARQQVTQMEEEKSEEDKALEEFSKNEVLREKALAESQAAERREMEERHQREQAEARADALKEFMSNRKRKPGASGEGSTASPSKKARREGSK